MGWVSDLADMLLGGGTTYELIDYPRRLPGTIRFRVTKNDGETFEKVQIIPLAWGVMEHMPIRELEWINGVMKEQNAKGARIALAKAKRDR